MSTQQLWCFPACSSKKRPKKKQKNKKNNCFKQRWAHSSLDAFQLARASPNSGTSPLCGRRLSSTNFHQEWICLFIFHQILLTSSIMFKTAFLLGYLKGKNGNQQEDVFFKKMRMFVRLGLSCPMGTLTLEPGPKSAPQRDISKSQICHQILPHNTFPFSSEICHF